MSEIQKMIALMDETPKNYRRACLADFFDEGEAPCENTSRHYNKNDSQNDNISKNQQEFGHRKRIKP
jgi:hypothetical protein